MVSKRQSLEERAENILERFCHLVEEEKIQHYRDITRDQIAKENKCSPARVSAIFGEMDLFRGELISYALQQDTFPRLITQAIVDDHEVVIDMPKQEKKQYLIAWLG